MNKAMVTLNSSLVEDHSSLVHQAAIICSEDREKVGELIHKLQFCDVEIMNFLILSA